MSTDEKIKGKIKDELGSSEQNKELSRKNITNNQPSTTSNEDWFDAVDLNPKQEGREEKKQKGSLSIFFFKIWFFCNLLWIVKLANTYGITKLKLVLTQSEVLISEIIFKSFFNTIAAFMIAAVFYFLSSILMIMVYKLNEIFKLKEFKTTYKDSRLRLNTFKISCICIALVFSFTPSSLDKMSESRNVVKVFDSENFSNYLVKITDSIRKDLPFKYEGFDVNAIEITGSNISFLARSTSSVNEGDVKSILMEFTCQSRELRVALLNQAAVQVEYSDVFRNVFSTLKIVENDCVEQQGKMVNYNDYDLSNQPDSSNPKVAALTYMGFWLRHQEIIKEAGCSLSSYSSPDTAQFSYYWSLLTLSPPMLNPTNNDFIKKSIKKFSPKEQEYVFDTIDSMFLKLKLQYENIGYDNKNLCERLHGAILNILGRQLNTLKSCIGGECVYGGTVNQTSPTNQSRLNKYPAGHPLLAIYAYTESYIHLNLLSELPECKGQTNQPVDLMGFVTKYNAIYSRSAPKDLLESEDVMKKEFVKFQRYGLNNKDLVQEKFDNLLISPLRGVHKDEALCEAARRSLKSIMNYQHRILERCLNGRCLNGVTP